MANWEQQTQDSEMEKLWVLHESSEIFKYWDLILKYQIIWRTQKYQYVHQDAVVLPTISCTYTRIRNGPDMPRRDNQLKYFQE